MSNGTPLSGRLGPTLTPLKRARTPNIHDDGSMAGDSTTEKELNPVADRRQKLMRDLYARSERMIDALYEGKVHFPSRGQPKHLISSNSEDRSSPAHINSNPQLKRKAARDIEEENYDDDDDNDDDENEEDAQQVQTSTLVSIKAQKRQIDSSPHSTQILGKKTSSSNDPNTLHKGPPKSPEEARKRLEEEKKATESAAKASFLRRIYTLENDRDAMLEQQKLDELDRQVETETSGTADNQEGSGQAQGTLSSANLGASSLALRHLIAQIDRERHRVPATDTEIQNLVSAVRKNRSKWASEDKVGQEELYEAAERVLMDLKAQTEFSTPFLQRVKQREAPDYHKIITKPMDIGTMLKKLKNQDYKSKKEFTDDLDLIWNNCLEYNKTEDHPLRKKAKHMMKETARLIPLIPDIVIRDRREIEAEEREERRRHFATLDDSDDDDQPIVATRGRKAPSKTAGKGTATARKAPPAADNAANESPAPESKPGIGPKSMNLNSSLKADHLRSEVDSVMEGSQNGFSTPPVGNHTPLEAGGLLDGAVAASHADASEIDGMNASMHGLGAQDQLDEAGEEDEEYKVWKQVTKKDRAQHAAERHRLFKGDRLNPEEPALVRTQAGMRRYMRQQRTLLGDDACADWIATSESKDGSDNAPSQTLAEGIDGEDDNTLPDYYNPVCCVPAIDNQLKWTEDAEGKVIERRDHALRMVPRGHFTAPKSMLNDKMEWNMKQMQETRRIMSTIGIVKQMLLQTQTYQNQFQSYQPEPFEEADVEKMIVTDDGPVIQPTLCRAALQRTIAKIFYHAGFEQYQPSALDAATDIIIDYLQRIITTLVDYHEDVWVNPAIPDSFTDTTPVKNANAADSTIRDINGWRPRFTTEEATILTLHRHGHDPESLKSYIEDDIPRLGQKLVAHHEAAKQYLNDLKRDPNDPMSVEEGNEMQYISGEWAIALGEDFLGLRAAGVDHEFGIGSSSVPFHLLRPRGNNAKQAVTGSGAGDISTNKMEEPPPWAPITEDTIKGEIELVQEFFREKLEKSKGAELVEDEALPIKQRPSKPRLPPSGKITSPRKRPQRELQMIARKKRRLEIEAEKERERQAQEDNVGTTLDGQGGGTVSVANASGSQNLDSSGTAAVVEEGAGMDSENSSRRQSNAHAINGAAPNGVLTNGEVEDGSPTTASSKIKPQPKSADKLKLDKPREEQNVNTDPHKQDRALPTPKNDSQSTATQRSPKGSAGSSGKSKQDSSNENSEKHKKPAEHSDDLHNHENDKDGDGSLLNAESLPIAAH